MTETTEHKIAEVEELEEHGSSIITEVDGKEICVYNIDGDYYGILNYCVHQSGPLCENGGLDSQVTLGEDNWSWEYQDKDKIVTCPWHSWKFDVTTGRNVDYDRYAVPTYDVEVKDGEIFVKL